MSFARLPAVEKRLLVFVMFALPAISALLFFFGLARTSAAIERLAERFPAKLDSSGIGELSPEKLARLVEVAGRRGPVTTTCLRQALLLYFLLRRRGLHPQLKIGVRRADGSLDAHAWVELDSRALGKGGDEHVVLGRVA